MVTQAPSELMIPAGSSSKSEGGNQTYGATRANKRHMTALAQTAKRLMNARGGLGDAHRLADIHARWILDKRSVNIKEERRGFLRLCLLGI